MLSKMLPPGVVDKHLPPQNSRRKEKPDSQETSEKLNQNNDQAVSKGSPSAVSGLNSNWEKFRTLVGQQDTTIVQKQPKRQHSSQNSRLNRKTPRIMPEVCHRLKQGTAVPEDAESKKELTKQIAIDCEMVGIGDGSESMLARVSLVNRHGVCVYDAYVKPREKIQDYRTAVSGIRPHHLTNAEDFKDVQSRVAEILHSRVLVGHALKNDLSVLFLSHPKRSLRDTSRYKPFRKVAMGNTPSLKKLAAELLGVDIQTGEHNSIEDARTAMQLYVLYKNQWENDIRSRS